MPIRLLFVCTAKAARSQMAEAVLQAVGGDAFEVHGAGTRVRQQVHPLAVRTLSQSRP
jgi:protein-tyrosine-phosphatase